MLLAAVADPRVERWRRAAPTPPRCTTPPPRSAPATTAATIASRLRRSGVDVVDAPPEDLAPALADHYLAMKATGRL